MPDEKKKVEGETTAAGRVKLTLNPPAAKEEGVEYKGDWIRAELDNDGVFTVRLFGQAQYGDRMSVDHVDLTDPGFEPIKDMLSQVLEAYSPSIKTKAMAGAFTARAFAIAQGEQLISKRDKPAE
jgi:hypothetical protein